MCKAGIACRSSNKGISYDLTAEWLLPKLEHGFCEATGIPFEYLQSMAANAGAGPWVPSIDRIEAGGDYTQANCRVVAWAFNRAKGTLSDDDLLKLSLAIVRSKHRLVLSPSAPTPPHPLPEVATDLSRGLSRLRRWLAKA